MPGNSRFRASCLPIKGPVRPLEGTFPSVGSDFRQIISHLKIIVPTAHFLVPFNLEDIGGNQQSKL